MWVRGCQVTSREQLARLMVLIPWLQGHPGATIGEVCQVFPITPAQLIKDLQVAVMCGLPGGMPDDLIDIDMDQVRGEGTITVSNAEFLSRPMRFTRDEALSLVVALQTIADTATGAIAQDALSAIAKLSPIVADMETIWMDLANGDPAIRESLGRAIARGRRLRLEYGGETRGQTTFPVIDPARLELRDSVLYLQAWSLEPADWRTFRVERIEAIEDIGAAGDHGCAPSLDQDWTSGQNLELVIEVDDHGAWIIDYYPFLAAETLSDGWLRVRLGVWDESWALRLLMRLGGHARLVEPASLVSRLEAARAEVLAAYRNLDAQFR